MKRIMISLLFLFFIYTPIFAEINSTIVEQENQKIMIAQMNSTNLLLQKIDENLNRTNNNIDSLKSSGENSSLFSETFENYRFNIQLLATFVVSLFGVSMGLFGNRMRDHQIEREKIRKVMTLFRDDVLRIRNNLNVILLDIERLSSILKTTNNIETDILNSGGIAKSISQILVNIQLLHWDAIVHSGYLIKLDTDEIRSLQSLQNYLSETRQQMKEFYKLKTDKIIPIIISQNSVQDKISEIKNQLIQLPIYFHFIYLNVSDKLIQVQHEIDWLSDNFNNRTTYDKINDWFKKRYTVSDKS